MHAMLMLGLRHFGAPLEFGFIQPAESILGVRKTMPHMILPAVGERALLHATCSVVLAKTAPIKIPN